MLCKKPFFSPHTAGEINRLVGFLQINLTKMYIKEQKSIYLPAKIFF